MSDTLTSAQVTMLGSSLRDQVVVMGAVYSPVGVVTCMMLPAL